jgi:hypothetical protein
MKSFSGFLSDCHVSSFRRFLTVLILFALIPVLTPAQVSINTDGSAPHSSSMLEVKSTSKGFLPPRMTFAQRVAIASPATGLILYQTDGVPGYYYYTGSSWELLGVAMNDFWLPNGSDIYYNSGRVAIGSTDSESNGLNVENYQYGKGAVRGRSKTAGIIYSEGYLGVLDPDLLGIPKSVYNIGVLGIKPNNGAGGAAVYGWNNDDNPENYGGIFVADGANAGIINYGIYCDAEYGNENLAAYFNNRIVVFGKSGLLYGPDYAEPVISAGVTHSEMVDTKAIQGVSKPSDGYGYGIYGEGGWRGVAGYGSGGAWTGTTIGVHGEATGTAGTRIGVYGTASGGTTANWAGYFDGDVYVLSDMRIATTTQATGYVLSVNGKIACDEVLLEDMAGWPDYVFDDSYKLTNLSDLEQSILKNRHLPGIPSAREIEENGLLLGDLQKKMLEKIEELTLYMIRQNKKIEALESEIDRLKLETKAVKR